MLPVFGERLVSSFGQLPDAHDSTLMVVFVSSVFCDTNAT
jgi:hypothetical protein